MLSKINRISYTAICTLITTTNTPVIHSFNLLPCRPSIHTFILNLHNTMCNPHQNTRNSLIKVFGPNIVSDKFSFHPPILVLQSQYYPCMYVWIFQEVHFNSFWKIFVSISNFSNKWHAFGYVKLLYLITSIKFCKLCELWTIY